MIRCVTREQFLALDGLGVRHADVQENQQGFARLAREVGARYLYQIGNTGQQVDMDTRPAPHQHERVPVPEGHGVTIHQEIDSAPRRRVRLPRADDGHDVVRNFVNAFNRLPGYAGVPRSRAGAQGLGVWEFTVHGHEGRDGFINPAARMGEAMASAGFGWHDKPVGDGFGHVIHSWAAVGRPLIGRAAYYRGKLAAPLLDSRDEHRHRGQEPRDVDALPPSQPTVRAPRRDVRSDPRDVRPARELRGRSRRRARSARAVRSPLRGMAYRLSILDTKAMIRSAKPEDPRAASSRAHQRDQARDCTVRGPEPTRRAPRCTRP
jgi:hypothetical protein